jgi:H+-translocating NAD(P) transhydrogenase subunit alpha
MAEAPLAVGVPRETFPGETRVAMVPAQVPALVKAGFRVIVELGAGRAAGLPDETYVAHGAEIADRDAVFATDLIVQVRTSAANPDAGAPDLALLGPGRTVIGLCDPLDAPEGLLRLAETGATVFALELVPRISRAQQMDVLSSQATIAGYETVVIAATRLPKIFPMLTTAAGTVTPARVLVIGAGVAGLQAIATARRLGAIVQAYDVRPAAQEDVESVGAKLVQLPLEPGDAEDASGYAKDLGEAFYRRQQEFLVDVVRVHDAVISTASIPGRPAPVLVTETAVEAMAEGSVVVDAAAIRGGNCALTRPDEDVVAHGVTILGPTNLPARAPFHASQLYARNVANFLLAQVHEEGFALDMDDEIVRATLAARDGSVVIERSEETSRGVTT